MFFKENVDKPMGQYETAWILLILQVSLSAPNVNYVCMQYVHIFTGWNKYFLILVKFMAFTDSLYVKRFKLRLK